MNEWALSCGREDFLSDGEIADGMNDTNQRDEELCAQIHQKTPKPHDTSAEHIQVLIVDNNPINILAYQNIFNKMNVDSVSANDG